MLCLVRSFSYTSHAISCLMGCFSSTSHATFSEEVSLTHLMLSLVRGLCYTPDASFSEEFL